MADRYQLERPGLGDDFTDAVMDAVEQALTYPDRGSPYLFGTRRNILTRFPYSVVYVVRPTRTGIVALAHHSRKPGCWAKRLRSIP